MASCFQFILCLLTSVLLVKAVDPGPAVQKPPLPGLTLFVFTGSRTLHPAAGHTGTLVHLLFLLHIFGTVLCVRCAVPHRSRDTRTREESAEHPVGTGWGKA